MTTSRSIFCTHRLTQCECIYLTFLVEHWTDLVDTVGRIVGGDQILVVRRTFYLAALAVEAGAGAEAVPASRVVMLRLQTLPVLARLPPTLVQLTFDVLQALTMILVWIRISTAELFTAHTLASLNTASYE